MWDSLSTFSKNLTINTIIITLRILFFSWSRLLIFRVESANLFFAKSISLINSSYTPNPNINRTIPIRNKSIDEIILNNKSLLIEYIKKKEETNSDKLFEIDLYNVKKVQKYKSHIKDDDTIDSITDIRTINLVLQSPFSNLFSIIY